MQARGRGKQFLSLPYSLFFLILFFQVFRQLSLSRLNVGSSLITGWIGRRGVCEERVDIAGRSDVLHGAAGDLQQQQQLAVERRTLYYHSLDVLKGWIIAHHHLQVLTIFFLLLLLFLFPHSSSKLRNSVYKNRVWTFCNANSENWCNTSAIKSAHTAILSLWNYLLVCLFFDTFNPSHFLSPNRCAKDSKRWQDSISRLINNMLSDA